MRVAFTIQGMGRGHLTQAIAASEILREAGHEIVTVVAGNHPGRDLPASFMDAFDAPLTVLPSPGFVFKSDRGVDMVGTLMHGIVHLWDWLDSVRRLRRVLSDAQPDVVLNFFEPLTGLMQTVRPIRVPVISVAHQFALLGPKWGAPSGTPVAPFWLRFFIGFVGHGSHKLALSFRPAHGRGLEASFKRVTVAPPLLRRRVLQLVARPGDYVLVYVATHGYGELVREWHGRHPEVAIHCFYDRPGAPAVEAVDETLSFHRLDAEKFPEFMAGCRAVVSTAGFESICEAAFLGKPVLMIPLENHHEQELNALDGESAGVAVGHPVFDLDALSRLPEPDHATWFRTWCLEAEDSLLDAIEAATRIGAAATQPIP